MARNPERYAKLFGAEIVGKVPDVNGGPFGMATLVNLVRKRLKPSRGLRPGRPTDPSWEHRPKVPMSQRTFEELERLAAEASTGDRKVTAMQVAALILEQALAQPRAARNSR